MASLYLFAAAAIPALVGYLATRGLSRLTARWGGDAMIDALIRRNAAATSSRTRSAYQAVDWGALNRLGRRTWDTTRAAQARQATAVEPVLVRPDGEPWDRPTTVQ